MNVFTDFIKRNREFIFDCTSTLPGIVLAVQKLLVDNCLEDSEVGKQLVNRLLQSASYEDACNVIYEYMS
jgi:hypothetical protein